MREPRLCSLVTLNGEMSVAETLEGRARSVCVWQVGLGVGDGPLSHACLVQEGDGAVQGVLAGQDSVL